MDVGERRNRFQYFETYNIGVCVDVHESINIRLRRKVYRIAANVVLLWILCTVSVCRSLPLRTPIAISEQWDALTIHADIVDVHVDRKQLFEPFIAVHQYPLLLSHP
jgi:hypothetical protein